MCYKSFSTGSDDVQKLGTKQNPKCFKSPTVIVTPLTSITKNNCEKYSEKSWSLYQYKGLVFVIKHPTSITLVTSSITSSAK